MLRLLALVLALGATGTMVRLLLGDETWAGDVVYTLTPTHGLHRGDVVVLVGWFACVCLALLLWDAGRRAAPRHRADAPAEVAPGGHEPEPTHRAT